jgi:GDP-L-fucose synthase
MNKEKKRILLTGASGFIGKNILEQLKLKYSILSPGHNELNLLDRVEVLQYLKDEKPDIVIHAATEGSKRTQRNGVGVLQKNLQMFFNLVDGKEHYKRMMVLGSGAEYDKREPLVKVDEERFGENVPVDEYGFSKYVMAKYAEEVDYITHLRFFGAFGKYEDYQTRFISNAICRSLLNLPIVMNQNVLFDYLYIDDLVKIISLFIEKIELKHKFYNIGTGNPIDLLSLAKLVLKISDKNLPIKILKSGLNNEYTCDNSRFQEEFPEFRFTDNETAIKSLHNYYSTMPELDKKNFEN